MVAAATTSLPEHARQGRNFDYRFAWIRDQCYAGQAVARSGPHRLMDDAVGFVSQRLLEDGENLSPAHTVAGGRVPDQREIDLSGYPGGSDIVGNWVNEQFQLDAFGESLLLFAAAARHDHLDADGWRAAEVAIEAIEKRWDEPGVDAGIWEIEPDAWTQSRLACAAGLPSFLLRPPRQCAAAGFTETTPGIAPASSFFVLTSQPLPGSNGTFASALVTSAGAASCVPGSRSRSDADTR